MKLLQLSKPHLLAVVGIAGSGKSVFAEKFSETFQAPLISNEFLTYLVTSTGLPQSETTALTKKLVETQLDELLKTARTIVVDIPTDSRTDRTALSIKARKNGYEVLFVWVQTDQSTAKDRAAKIAKNATNRQLTGAQYDQLTKHFTPPNATEHTVVISGKHTYASQAKVVLKRLSGPRAEVAKLGPTPERVAAPQAPVRRNVMVR